MRKKLKPSVIIFAVMLVLLIGYSITYMYTCYAIVPDVVGISASKAVKMCEKKGITRREIDADGILVSEIGLLTVVDKNGDPVATRFLNNYIVTKQSRNPGELFKKKDGIFEALRDISITDTLTLVVKNGTQE